MQYVPSLYEGMMNAVLPLFPDRLFQLTNVCHHKLISGIGIRCHVNNKPIIMLLSKSILK